MENKLITVPEDFTDTEEDNLSLCNFAISGYEEHENDDNLSPRKSISSDTEPFEFFHEVNEYQKRDYLCLKSASSSKARGFEFYKEGRELNRSSSNRVCRSSKANLPSARKVNITAITDMSAKSRRRMFMFGPVKFKPEMDVDAIRKRSRSRLGPVNIPPMPEEFTETGMEMAIVKSGGGRGKSVGGGGGGAGGMLRPLWCRSHLATALAKSLGCISASMV
ncbi:hypothetical protein Vadar_023624 [Vaccinium darrowii]|uniref:Uncharacterized protein n=1 Tax=Vaccinium darrowii TaxID=229202 RepID=A0ACB7XJT6_9ERIC|nr:hypothetical protein Vadar_023624 [Vaccinium darrowii]